MAWSGDVINILQLEQSGDQDFQFALPTEGGMLWTDNMVIPKGAANKGQAELWIDFYYEPINAATVEAWVFYVCPVKGAREAMVDARSRDRGGTPDLPDRRDAGQPLSVPRHQRGRGDALGGGLLARHRV